jgi:hypothetical protein
MKSINQLEPLHLFAYKRSGGGAGLHKCQPTTALRGQNLLALGRQAVIAPAAQ